MKNGNYIGALNICDICQNPRSRGNHSKCSEERKRRYAADNAAARKRKSPVDEAR